MTPRRVVLVLAAYFLVGASIAPSVARADTESADALFREGRRLLEEGKTDEACLKLAESQAQDPSSGTLLNLGFCHELQHRLAAAWSEYVSAAQLARNQGKEDRALVAEGKAKDLEPRLPYLTVAVAVLVPGLQISRGTQRLGPELLGRSIPVDPGSYVVTASAPGRRDWRTTVDVAESESKTVVVPELQSVTAAATEPPEQRPAAPQIVAPVRRSTSSPTGRGALGWIVGGAGVATVAVGAGFGLASLASYDQANNSCPSHRNCSEGALSARNSAETKAWIANIAFGVGVIGIGVGSWILLSGGGKEPATRMAIYGTTIAPGMRVGVERSF